MIDSMKDIMLLKELARGGFGKVYLARFMSKKQFFALKVIRKPTKEKLKNLLKNEIKIFQTVKSPFLCKMKFCFETLEKVYFGLELMNGDLVDIFPRDKRYDEGIVQFYLAEITLALEHLHNQKVLYRDLKPENILIAKDGHIKLTDFGLSEINFTKDSKTTTDCGTLTYMAPEMMDGAQFGFKVDLWALGVLAYRLFMGRRLFLGEDKTSIMFRVMNNNIDIPSNLSLGAQALIKGLVNRNVEERWDISEVKNSSFFDGVRWNKVLAKDYKPPFIGKSHEYNKSDKNRPFDTPCKNKGDDYERFINYEYDGGDFSKSSAKENELKENEKPVCRQLDFAMSNLNINKGSDLKPC